MAIYTPSQGPDSWRRLLAEPEKQWQTRYSARSVAHSWEAARGLPPEIDSILGGKTELLLAIPEHKVPLPGGGHASQCDVFALVRQGEETIAMAVEAKVNEAFGPTVGEWLVDASDGKLARLGFIVSLLGVTLPVPPDLHYQLFHRTAAAIVERNRFKTNKAAMIVQSFSQQHMWFDAFAAFVAYLGGELSLERAASVSPPTGPLVIGWATGDERFLNS